MTHGSPLCQKFEYLKSIDEICPRCVIEHILSDFYVPRKYRYEYEWHDYSGHDIICTIVQSDNFYSKILIYYQNKQWQYVRLDLVNGKWIEMESQFLDLRGCVDIFQYEKDINRFVRSIWDCGMNWKI